VGQYSVEIKTQLDIRDRKRDDAANIDRVPRTLVRDDGWSKVKAILPVKRVTGAYASVEELKDPSVITCASRHRAAAVARHRRRIMTAILMKLPRRRPPRAGYKMVAAGLVACAFS